MTTVADVQDSHHASVELASTMLHVKMAGVDVVDRLLMLCQGAALSDNEVEVKTSDDPHKLLDINLDEYAHTTHVVVWRSRLL